MSYDWHWRVFLESANGRETYLDWLIAGLWSTVQIGTYAWILAFLLGSCLGVMRTLPGRIAPAIATAYVEVVRNIPLIVQLFLWYYVMPKLLPEATRSWLFSLPPAKTAFVTATLGLGFFTSMGLTRWQTYRHVLLPVAYRMIVPPMTSEILSIFKNSSIAGTVGVLELFARARQLNDYTARGYESFGAVILCYLIINAVVIVAMSMIERRARLPGMVAGR